MMASARRGPSLATRIGPAKGRRANRQTIENSVRRNWRTNVIIRALVLNWLLKRSYRYGASSARPARALRSIINDDWGLAWSASPHRQRQEQLQQGRLELVRADVEAA